MKNIRLRIISLTVITTLLLASAFAQSKQQQKTAPKADNQTSAAAPGGTSGRIVKFTITKALGDSNITEDGSGKIGIGTTLPSSSLTVNGVIETTSAQGGIKF